MAFLLRSLFLVLLVFFCHALSHGSMPMIRCHPHESQALLRFKAALNETDSQGSLSSWANGTDCCTNWTGISCDNHTSHVLSVSVIPSSDGYYLYVNGTYFYSNGYYLYANGVISESLCQLPFLTSLATYAVSGRTLPSCLGNLSFIQSLHLSGNGFSGMLHPFICLLTRLTYLDLLDNHFNGSIPSCLGNLSSLTKLALPGNRLSGIIPSFLGHLSFLTHLSLGSNQLSGSIPAFLGKLSLLRHLYLYNNQLSGTIPYSLGNLSLLQGLAIDDNQLSGTIPPSFAQLSSLTYLHADGNHFNESSSSLPPSLVQLRLQLNHYQSISETF